METIYHLFVTIPSGLPVIIPDNNPILRELFVRSHVYDPIHQGSAEECINKQMEILDRMYIIPRQS